jgi:hypothetical protein
VDELLVDRAGLTCRSTGAGKTEGLHGVGSREFVEQILEWALAVMLAIDVSSVVI